MMQIYFKNRTLILKFQWLPKEYWTWNDWIKYERGKTKRLQVFRILWFWFTLKKRRNK